MSQTSPLFPELFMIDETRTYEKPLMQVLKYHTQPKGGERKQKGSNVLTDRLELPEHTQNTSSANYNTIESLQRGSQASDPLKNQVLKKIGACHGDDGISSDEESPRRQCLICYGRVPETQIRSPLPCRHSYCCECYRRYLEGKIGANQVLDIKCPDYRCLNKLTDAQIKRILSTEGYGRYIERKQTKELILNPNVRWCVNPKCGKPVKGSKWSRKVECECGTLICFKCRNEYHPDKSCNRAMETGYKDYIDRNDVQKCPRCKSKVEKNNGCNHMTCSMCNYHWCWLCGGKYSRFHYDDLNPFGCTGLLDQKFTRSRYPFWKILLRRCSLTIAFVVLLLLVWPFNAVILLPLNFKEYIVARRIGRSRVGRIMSFIVSVLLFLVSLGFLPIPMLVCAYNFSYNMYYAWKKDR